MGLPSTVNNPMPEEPSTAEESNIQDTPVLTKATKDEIIAYTIRMAMHNAIQAHKRNQESLDEDSKKNDQDDH